MYRQVLEIDVDCQPEQQPKHTENQPYQQQIVAIHAEKIDAGKVRKFEVGFAGRLSSGSKIPLRLSESRWALQNEKDEHRESDSNRTRQ